MGVDGSGLRQLTHAAPLVPDGARWSPDGRQVLFSTDHGATPSDWAVWVIDADGTDLTRLTPRDGTLNFESDWSPDGTHIVFKHFEDGDDFNSLRVMEADGSAVVTILTNPSGQTSETPDWGASR